MVAGANSPTFSAGRGMRLEKVVGLSATNKNMIDVGRSVDGGESVMAYPVGCVVVVVDASSGKQLRYMRMAKPVACLRFSPCGSLLAVGERGHNPAITVWKVANGSRLSELKGHKFGVSCMRFSPSGDRLASVGFEHDDTLKIWEWRNSANDGEQLVGESQLDTPGLALDYAMLPGGGNEQLVTVGAQQIRFWEVARLGELVGHQAGLLPYYKDAVFTDATFGEDGSLFVSTQCGSLVCLAPNRLMDKWVFLEARACHALSIIKGRIACACSGGIVRVFDATSFEFVATLPFPRRVDQSLDKQSDAPPQTESAEELLNASRETSIDKTCIYADSLSVLWSGDGKDLSAVYADRSLLIWDLSDIEAIKKRSCYVTHPTSVTGIQCMPGGKSDSTFVTCSEDHILRFWKLGNGKKKQDKDKDKLWCNAFSNELVREIQIERDNEESSKKQISKSPMGADTPESHDGVKCLSVSKDGKLIATGHKSGRVFVYDFGTERVVLDQRKAHNGEVMSVEFSPPLDEEGGKKTDQVLLATGGRDRLVHLFNSRDLRAGAVKTLKDHSATVTAVKFSSDGKKLLSAGGDKIIVLSKLEKTGANIRVSRQQSVAMPQHGTAFAVDIDASGKYFCTAGQDKKINIWSLNNGKAIRSYKLSEGGFDNAGELSAVRLDPAGMFCATGSQDKSVRLFDFYSGECMARSAGHSETITGLAFSRDCKRLVSVARDGCMFVWRLAPEITAAIRERQHEIEMQATIKSTAISSSPKSENVQRQGAAHNDDNDDNKDFVIEEEQVGIQVEKPHAEENEKQLFFASERLPTWAKTKSLDIAYVAQAIDSDSTSNSDSSRSRTPEPQQQQQQGNAILIALEQLTGNGNVSPEDVSSETESTSAESPPSVISPGVSILSSVSTAPREPLPVFEKPRSLAQERKSLKLKETKQSVRRMRDQLKGMGLLEATMQKHCAAVIQEEDEDTSATIVAPLEYSALAEDCEDIPGLVSPGESALNAATTGVSVKLTVASALTPLDQKKLSPLRTLEIPGENSTASASLASAFHNANLNKPTTTNASMFTPDSQLRSADDARAACGFALSQLQSALSSTVEIFSQVARFDQKLEQSIESVHAEGGDHFTKDILLTSRNNVQGVMGEFQAQLNGMVSGELQSINSCRSTAPRAQNISGNATVPSSVNPNNFNNSMFLNAHMGGEMQVQAMMDKLNSISTMLEEVRESQTPKPNN